jgi:hypothetical protein
MFHFAFCGGDSRLRTVVPRTYSEAMKFVEGHRKFVASAGKLQMGQSGEKE